MGKPVPEDVLEDERQAKERAVPHVAFFDPDFERDRERDPHTEKERLSERGRERLSQSQSQSQAEKIREFYRLLAVCHEVIPERLEDGRVKNSAPNPDDEALVCAAAFFGYEFVDRRDGIVVVRVREPARDGEEKRDTHKDLEIELLYTIPFSSARKRMSVIVRDVDGRIKVVSKGADSAMFARSVQDNELVNTLTAEHLDRFSTEGLRCLVVAVKELDEEQFSVWRTHYDAASTDLNEMEKKKRGELNDIETMEDFIEKDLRVSETDLLVHVEIYFARFTLSLSLSLFARVCVCSTGYRSDGHRGSTAGGRAGVHRKAERRGHQGVGAHGRQRRDGHQHRRRMQPRVSAAVHGPHRCQHAQRARQQTRCRDTQKRAHRECLPRLLLTSVP